MKLFNRFLLLSRGKQIAIAVCLLHLFAIFMLFGHHLITKSKPIRPMIVKTHVERKVEQPKVEKPMVAVAKPQAVAPKPVAKKAAPKPAPVAKKIAPPVKQDPVLKEIAQSFEALSSQTKKSRPTLNLPSKIESKAQLAPESDPSYGEYLITYLQNALDLPEYGDVRVKLEIDRFGRLIDCQVLEAKSVKNAEFLKNRLPDLSFACLNDYGIMDATETFTVTFRNVENH